MSEVEKMYRNAHVYPRIYGDITKETFENKVFNMGDMCKEAFTAEKQLELIKWLLKNFDIDFSQLGQKIDTSLDGINCIGGIGSADTFEDSLCMAVNDLWQDLTEEERKQIKEILE